MEALNKYKVEVLEVLSNISKDIEIFGRDRAIELYFREKENDVENVDKELENLLKMDKRVIDFEKELLDSTYGKFLNKAFDKLVKNEIFTVEQILSWEITFVISFLYFIYIDYNIKKLNKILWKFHKE